MRLTKYRSTSGNAERRPFRGSSSASRELCCSATESFAGKLPHKQVERATKAFWRQPPRNSVCAFVCACVYVYIYIYCYLYLLRVCKGVRASASPGVFPPSNGSRRARGYIVHTDATMRAYERFVICANQLFVCVCVYARATLLFSRQQYRPSEATQTALRKIQGECATRVNPFLHVGSSREINDSVPAFHEGKIRSYEIPCRGSESIYRSDRSASRNDI